MIIQKAFQFRIYPTEEQQKLLAVQFGHARFVSNYYLDLRSKSYQETGKGMNYYQTAKHLVGLKSDREYSWLREADSQVLQQKLGDLEKAFKNYFRMCKTGTLPSSKGKKPRKDGKPRGYPRFKCKRDKQSIRYPQRFKVGEDEIYLPKVGWVPMIQHRHIEGEMKNCTVMKTKSGKYFVSIQCELEVPDPEPRINEPGVGLDLGLIDFIVTSDGWKVPVAKYLRKSERRLRMLQRSQKRKVKGSKNKEKARKQLALKHEQVANQRRDFPYLRRDFPYLRRDFHHQLSAKLVQRYGHIGFEDLNIKGMLGNHRLAKSIQDAGWGQFVRFCEYKQEWSGGTTSKADRWFPSSKTCSECGSLNQQLQLSDREWLCLECGVLHDRDENAAINILKTTIVRNDEESLRR